MDCASENDLTLSPADLERKITPRTRLIVTMPYGGFCPDMNAILEIARARGVAVAEDACHAPLAELDGRKIGTFGAVSTWSFYGNKNMTTGEGGMAITNDEEIARRIRLLRSHGMTALTWDRQRGHASAYDVVELGYNYRMDELRAAIGRGAIEEIARGQRQAVARGGGPAARSGPLRGARPANPLRATSRNPRASFVRDSLALRRKSRSLPNRSSRTRRHDKHPLSPPL